MDPHEDTHTWEALTSALRRWAWVGVLAVAVLTRLTGLAATPLTPVEATRALPSLDAARGADWPLISESPLLLVGNAFLFFVLGAGDGVARLLPAVAGVGLVAVPWLWRGTLNRVGRLTAATLMLLSPLALFGARHLVDAAPATLAGALLVTGLAWALEGDEVQRHRAPRLVALGLGLGLIAGPTFYVAALPGCVALLLWRRPWPAGWTRTLGRAAWIGGAGALAVSTALGLRWSGWAGPLEPLATWLTGGTLPLSHAPLTGQLLLYEPLLVALALVGLGVALASRTSVLDPWLRRWLVWGALGLLLLEVWPTADAVALVAVILPLALAAGYTVAHLAAGVTLEARRAMGLYLLLATTVWLVGLLIWAELASGFLYLGGPLVLALGGVALLALEALFYVLFLLRVPSTALWRGALLSVLLVIGLVQAGAAFGLSFVRTDTAVEPAVDAVTSPDMAMLRTALLRAAVRQGLRRDAFPVTLLGMDPTRVALLRWTLRDFGAVKVDNAWPEAVSGVGAVITSDQATGLPEEASSWRGMPFTAWVEHRGGPKPGDPGFGRWVLYRIAPDAETLVRVVLWLRQ